MANDPKNPTKQDLNDITPLSPEELQQAFGGARRPRVSKAHHRAFRRAMR